MYGSKKLIEDLSLHGYTLPYTEIRHFLTSAAVYMATNQQKTASGAIVPASLARDNRQGLVMAAADNWDHNENTLSGKGSTHAMTSILISIDHNNLQPERIPRVQERALETCSLPGCGLSSILHYEKPCERPSPKLTPPVRMEELKCNECDSVKTFKLKELLYHMSRHKLMSMCDDRAYTFPTWHVYQSMVESDCISEPADIVYNPIIMASPTNLNTVYTTLKRTKEQMIALGQTVCPITFDMGLLTKALEITWANPKEFSGVVPIEGGMHYMMALFGGIGHIYGDAGLKDLLVDSNVFANNTAEHILSGKDFDRALKAVIMVDEVLNRRFLKQFYAWTEANSKSVPQLLWDYIISMDGDSKHDGGIANEVYQQLETDIQPMIDLFRSEGREVSPLFKFWDSYLTEVSLPVKMFLASSRHAVWDVNLYAKTKLLPFLFASNRTIYSRFMPYQVLAMKRVPEELSSSFSEGLFVSKLTKGSFNAVWNDYVLEVTENKALKSSGGIIGLTHNDKALNRWFMSRPVTAQYANQYNPRNSGSTETKSDKYHSDTNFHTNAYNDGVKKMLELFDDNFIDPFSVVDPPNKLVNFATGVEASSDVQHSLLRCHQKGNEMLHNFVSERLSTGENKSAKKKFFDPMPRTNVKTMKAVKSKINTQSKVVAMSREEMYLRLLAINAYKKVPLERVLSFENAPVPISLFKDDGTMTSTKKSDFLDKLENISGSPCSVKSIQDQDCVVYDAMAIVQMLQPSLGATYLDMASLFWNYILIQSKDVSFIHVVFDRYIQNSLKSATRQKRGENTTVNSPVVMQYKMNVPDWKKLLMSSRSKGELTKLYTRYFAENCHELLKPGQVVYVSGGLGDKVLKLTSDTVMYHSCSNQEEADTRILLH